MRRREHEGAGVEGSSVFMGEGGKSTSRTGLVAWVGGWGGGGGGGDTLHVLSPTHFLKIHYIVMHLYESLYTSLISVWSLHAFIFVLLVELNFS